jgi:hypothetical protein
MTLSPTAYARHRKALGLPGGTHVAVLKAIKAGRIEPEPDRLHAEHRTLEELRLGQRARRSHPLDPAQLSRGHRRAFRWERDSWRRTSK